MDNFLDFIHECVLLGIPITCNINVNTTHSVNSLLYVKSNSYSALYDFKDLPYDVQFSLFLTYF